MRKGIVVPILLAVVAGCSEGPTATEPTGDIGAQAARGGVTDLEVEVSAGRSGGEGSRETGR